MIIKLMSFNIQHGRNHNLAGDVVDLPLMAKVIRDVSPLFVGLQEVYADQPSILSAMTGGSACFGRATIDEREGLWQRGNFSSAGALLRNHSYPRSG